MSSNGQEFIFEPKPKKPSILVGGMSAAAFERAVNFGAGWFPIGRFSEIKDRIKLFHDLTERNMEGPLKLLPIIIFQDKAKPIFLTN